MNTKVAPPHFFSVSRIQIAKKKNYGNMAMTVKSSFCTCSVTVAKWSSLSIAEIFSVHKSQFQVYLYSTGGDY